MTESHINVASRCPAVPDLMKAEENYLLQANKFGFIANAEWTQGPGRVESAQNATSEISKNIERSRAAQDAATLLSNTGCENCSGLLRSRNEQIQAGGFVRDCLGALRLDALHPDTPMNEVLIDTGLAPATE